MPHSTPPPAANESPPDFGALLRGYMARTGVSDAELARSVGVSRQTVFRWKEGHVGSPRRRAHVTLLAGKLRLTPDERDTLLLAAGFAPDRSAPADRSGRLREGPADQIGEGDTDEADDLADELAADESAEDGGAADGQMADGQMAHKAAADDRAGDDRAGDDRAADDRAVDDRLVRTSRMRRVATGLVVVGLALAVAYTLTRDSGAPGGPNLRAAPGEALIVVAADTADEAAHARRSARRLRDAAQRELRSLRIVDSRAELVPQTVDSAEAAGELLQASGAEVLIWMHTKDGRLWASLFGTSLLGDSLPGDSLLGDSLLGGGEAIPLESPDPETLAVAKWSAALVAAGRGESGTARALLGQSRSLAESSPLTDVLEATLGRLPNDG